MSLNSVQPVDWALHIMQRIADVESNAESAPGQTWFRQPGANLSADDAVLSDIEMQLSALVERHWGDADELEALQLQLARQDVRRALLELLRSGTSRTPLPPA